MRTASAAWCASRQNVCIGAIAGVVSPRVRFSCPKCHSTVRKQVCAKDANAFTFRYALKEIARVHRVSRLPPVGARVSSENESHTRQASDEIAQWAMSIVLPLPLLLLVS